MAEGNQIVIHRPVDGETLKQYMGRYTEEEIEKIFESPEISIDFCLLLIDTPWAVESEQKWQDKSFQKVWEIIRRRDDVNVLFQYIDLWEPTRRKLLELLSNSPNDLKKLSKWCSSGRLIGCAIDSGSTIGGLCLQDTGYASYSDSMLNAATFFGLLALGSTIVEWKISEDRLNKIRTFIERDQGLYRNIRQWFQQIPELEIAMSMCFPFDLTEKYLEDFSSIRASASSSTSITTITSLIADAYEMINDLPQVLKFLSRRVVEACRRTENVKVAVEKLTNFVRSSEFGEVTKRIYIGKLLSLDPFVLDLTRAALQIRYSPVPVRYLFCQSVKELFPKDQHLGSWPVWGRIILNGCTILSSVSSFWNHEVPGIHEMETLKIQLEGELDALNRMIRERDNLQ